MKSRDGLLAVFTARIERHDGSLVVEIPEREVGLGTLSEGQSYRVAFLQAEGPVDSSGETKEPSPSSEPPVSRGDRIAVEIEDVGEQGDGIARVGPGYVVFVDGADTGDRVTVEVRKVLDNYAFAGVVEPEPISG